jgi:pyruvate formate lyase activating enzyme
MKHGTILNIQRYCLHDGPGIRTTVFLKGCPLSCWWCHNPESRSAQVELVRSDSRCVRCGQCREACPQQHDPGDLQSPACTRCGACVAACPTGARQFLGREMDVPEVLDVVLRDRLFYEESGGGVTLSGGEPLLQAEFSLELLQACRAASIHTAVDTCGFAPRETLLACAPHVDVFLYDIKACDDETHRRHTGVSNRLILENLAALAAVHNDIWIRIPLIPGINLADNELQSTADLVQSLRGVRQVNLLPYHALGTNKPGGLAAPSAAASSVSPGDLERAAGIFRAAGLHTLIGG